MRLELLTERRLEFLSLKGGCTGSSKSTPVKMIYCWKSHVEAQLYFYMCYNISPVITVQAKSGLRLPE